MIEGYEKVGRNDMIKRISVLLDSKSFEALNKLMNEKHLKISDVVRLSIMNYYNQEMGGKNVEGLSKYAQYLSDGSHLILDIELFASLLSSIDTKSESFWKNVEMEGHKHGVYYRSIGLTDIEEILRQKEVKNWFKIRKESDECFLLILPSSEVQKFMKHFLIGLSTALDASLEIKEIGTRNLLVRKI